MVKKPAAKLEIDEQAAAEACKRINSRNLVKRIQPTLVDIRKLNQLVAGKIGDNLYSKSTSNLKTMRNDTRYK